MAISPMYLPTPGQADAQARASTLSCTVTSSTIPPVYAAACTAAGAAPYVVAEYSGMVVALSDAGETLTAGQVTNLIAPLVAAQTAANTVLANQATITANALAHVPANISYLAVAVPSVAQTTAQLNAITKAVNALIYLVNEQFTTTQGT